MAPLALFGVAEAQHYCGTFNASPAPTDGSVDAYVATGLAKSLREGTVHFDHYRDCSLRDAERRIFMAVSHYRRSLDLMTPGAAWWAHVTLYYGSFFAAGALLAMFGGRVLKNSRIEVKASRPGNQELIVVSGSGSTYGGSHQRFWDLFYSSVRGLLPDVDAPLRIALAPVNNKVTWQIDSRNLINYDSFRAIELAGHFQAAFDKRKFPSSLPGMLGTQFEVFEALLLLTLNFAVAFGMITDALHSLVPAGTRRAKLRRLVFEDRAPALSRKIKHAKVLV